MSSASDISAFEHSVEPAPAETLFRDKKWTYIQDSTSNTGQYAGQIQFNLSTISSQAAFLNWEEAVLELPVKLQILNGGAGSVTSTAACTIDQLVPKAGAWQFIDSVQVVIDGTTVQTNQVHKNVNTTFKAITETVYNTYVKHGPTSNFVLDKYATPTIQGSSGAAQSLENLATSSFMTATNSVGEQRKSSGCIETSSDVAPAGAVAAGSPFYVAHYLACIKLRYISDYFKKYPLQKNTRGFIYLNYNSSSTTLVTTGTAGVVAPATIASLSNNMNFGNTCPVPWNLSSGATTTALAGGLALPASAVTLTITADINGTPTAGTGITPTQSFSRLLVPSYSPNPSADHALAQKKTFRNFERITNQFTVTPGASFTWTVSNGIANPKRLIMQPVITNPTAGATVSDVINPFRSPFSTSGVDGGLDDVTSAGLLSQRQWESLYRFVAVDIGRRLPSEDGASKSIIVSGTSNCNYALTIYYHVLREVVASVDTAMGTVS
ncbi:unnamed protein product [Phytophthora lilii]|uniref:Unnamed protein product n=1 Tax=Phytophthora lilii TaxID=2077276 RepID=A0A9W6XA66_9STRA|nr:unnamed protein product [Phytophthora lilii]